MAETRPFNFTTDDQFNLQSVQMRSTNNEMPIYGQTDLKVNLSVYGIGTLYSTFVYLHHFKYSVTVVPFLL